MHSLVITQVALIFSHQQACCVIVAWAMDVNIVCLFVVGILGI